MAEERNLTPEKQLLKLIEDPKSKATIAMEAQAVKYNSFLSLGAWLGRFSFFKEKTGKWFKSGRHQNPDNIRMINQILALVIAVTLVYFIFNLFISLSKMHKTPNLQFKMPDTVKQVPLKESSLLRNTSYYLEKVRQRDIFKMGSIGSSSAGDAAKREAISKIMELSQNLKLVGISWSDDPDAMIEDTKAARTFFIKRGQMVGDLKVQAIFKDKVVLSYGKEEVDLR